MLLESGVYETEKCMFCSVWMEKKLTKTAADMVILCLNSPLPRTHPLKEGTGDTDNGSLFTCHQSLG